MFGMGRPREQEGHRCSSCRRASESSHCAQAVTAKLALLLLLSLSGQIFGQKHYQWGRNFKAVLAPPALSLPHGQIGRIIASTC